MGTSECYMIGSFLSIHLSVNFAFKAPCIFLLNPRWTITLGVNCWSGEHGVATFTALCYTVSYYCIIILNHTTAFWTSYIFTLCVLSAKTNVCNISIMQQDITALNYMPCLRADCERIRKGRLVKYCLF